MKITQLSIGIVASVLLTLSSCKKEECHECHYDKNGEEVELGKKCGEDLENLEREGYTDGANTYEVHCSEH